MGKELWSKEIFDPENLSKPPGPYFHGVKVKINGARIVSIHPEDTGYPSLLCVILPAYLPLYFQVNLQYELSGISFLLFTSPANLKNQNIISVLRIILKRWSRSMTSVLQSSTVFSGPMWGRSFIAIPGPDLTWGNSRRVKLLKYYGNKHFQACRASRSRPGLGTGRAGSVIKRISVVVFFLESQGEFLYSAAHKKQHLIRVYQFSWKGAI
jgi:hypothetical protein